MADAEKLEEEHLLRLENEARRAAVVQQRTQAAKQEIILRALQVFHGLLVRCAHTRLSSYHCLLYALLVQLAMACSCLFKRVCLKEIVLCRFNWLWPARACSKESA